MNIYRWIIGLVSLTMIFGAAMIEADTIGGAMTAPTNLFNEGLEPDSPVYPYFAWDGVSGATWFHLYLRTTDDALIYTEWYDASIICDEMLACELEQDETYYLFPTWGLVNGDYEWWVGAYDPGSGTTSYSGGASYTPATFTINVPAPELPTVYARWDYLQPRITVVFGANTEWVQIYAGGNGYEYMGWHQRDNDLACDHLQCVFVDEHRLPLDWPAGDYVVWVQAWGPGGFSSPDGSDSAASWVESAYIADATAMTFPSVEPFAPTSLAAESTEEGASIRWIPIFGTSWYEVTLINDDGQTMHQEWYHVGDVGCTDGGIEFLVCTVILEDLPFDEYEIRIRGWGPGSYTIGGPNDDGYGVLEWTYGLIIVIP